MKVPTDWYDVELVDNDGHKITHQVYSPDGFESAMIQAKNEAYTATGISFRVTCVTRVLREASLTECMLGVKNERV